MKTATYRRVSGGLLTRAALFGVLALAATLLGPPEARAQWTTSGVTTSTTNRIGVGTPDPTHGNVVGSMFTVATADDTATAFATSNGKLPRFALNNHADGSWTMYDYAGNASWNMGITQRGGSVGIGTTAPAFLLDVNGSSGTPFRVRDSAGREYFSTSTRSGPYGVTPIASLAGGRLIVEHNGPDGNNNTIIRRVVNSMIFSPSDHPTLPGGLFVQQVGGTYGLFVDQQANGNVGVGTTAPAAKLDVNGDIRVSGNINAKYQDVAEWVPSTQKLQAGTVVVLDTSELNHVRASASAYDTGVAGVISAQPGISLGEKGEGKLLVATTGRVKVKVDATRGAIKVGDLLVTSDVAGVAMKSRPLELGGVAIHRPGTIIGKALEPLEKGTGEILVLLSLQ